MKKARGALAVVGVLAVGLTACTGSGAPSPTEAGGDRQLSCTNQIVNPGAPQVLLWGYWPGIAEVVDNYNESHGDVQVCWNNSGAGGDTYTKFNTALAANSGIPDLIHLEYAMVPGYVIQGALTDMNEYGAEDVRDQFGDGTWGQASVGDGTYGIPVDVGPVAMFTRQDIFDQYGVAVPHTWAEFADAAHQLRANGFQGYITNFPLNGREYVNALMANAGATPFDYDPAAPTDIKIRLDSPEVNEVLGYWNELIDEGLVSTFDRSSPEDNARILDGTYATLISGAWAPGYLSGLVDGGVPDGNWKVAPMPKWDLNDPHEATWGGSVVAMPKAAHNPDLASKVAKDLFLTDDRWEIANTIGKMFPGWLPKLESDAFANRPEPFFGGQTINKDVFIPELEALKPALPSPFQLPLYDITNKALAAMVAGDATPEETAGVLQSEVEAYAKQQGFNVQ